MFESTYGFTVGEIFLLEPADYAAALHRRKMCASFKWAPLASGNPQAVNKESFNAQNLLWTKECQQM